METKHPMSSLIQEIKETHRQRVDLHRAEKSMTLRIKAIERRMRGGQCVVDFQKPLAPAAFSEQPGHTPADTQSLGAGPTNGSGGHLIPEDHPPVAALPFLTARELLATERKKLEKRLEKLAKQLPVFDAFVKPINGMGPLGLAQIVGEAGDLTLYANPGKLWKRMGLAVIDGRAQRRVAGAAALEHGYSPQRRSIMFCIGDSLIKKQNPYRDLYLSRKEYEKEKEPELRPIHHHRRAQRYMEKRLLKQLWQAWRAVQGSMPRIQVPAAHHSAAA